MKIFNMINPANKNEVEIQWFKTVQELEAGADFGALALQYNQPRSATIVCSERTSLASLSRFDYSLIIGKEQRRKMKRTVDELKDYRIFATLRPNTIAKIFLYMEKVEFTR